MTTKTATIDPGGTPHEIASGDIIDASIREELNTAAICNLTINNYIAYYREEIDEESEISVNINGKKFRGFIRRIEPKERPQVVNITAYDGLWLYKSLTRRAGYNTAGYTAAEYIKQWLLRDNWTGAEVDGPNQKLDEHFGEENSKLRVMDKIITLGDDEGEWAYWARYDWADDYSDDWVLVTNPRGGTPRKTWNIEDDQIRASNPRDTKETYDEVRVIGDAYFTGDGYEHYTATVYDASVDTPNRRVTTYDDHSLGSQSAVDQKAQSLYDKLSATDYQGRIEVEPNVDFKLLDKVQFKDPFSNNIIEQRIMGAEYNLTSSGWTCELQIGRKPRLVEKVTTPTWLKDVIGMVDRRGTIIESTSTPTSTDKIWLDISVTPRVWRRYSPDAGAWVPASWNQLSDMLGNSDDLAEGQSQMFAAESGADVTGNHSADVDALLTINAPAEANADVTGDNSQSFSWLTGYINSGQIDVDTIDSPMIVDNAIVSNLLAASAVVSNAIAADAILSNHITADAILSNHIKAGEVSTDHILFNDGTAPSTPSNGQMWYNDPYLKFQSGGSTQTISYGADITIEHGEDLIYFQANAPSSPQNGWFWIDSDTFELYRWDGSSWNLVHPNVVQGGAAGEFSPSTGTWYTNNSGQDMVISTAVQITCDPGEEGHIMVGIRDESDTNQGYGEWHLLADPSLGGPITTTTTTGFCVPNGWDWKYDTAADHDAGASYNVSWELRCEFKTMA